MKKIPRFYSFFYLLLFIVHSVIPQASCKITEAGTKSARPNKAPLLQTVVLTFSGDIMAHDVNYSMKDYSKIYEDVQELLSADSLSFGNIEMPVCDELPLSNYPNFNVHSDYLKAAATAGFDVFSFANNHTNDRQIKGIEGTAASFKRLHEEFLKEKSRRLYASGLKAAKEEAFKPVLIEKDGCKILFLAVTEILNSHDKSKELVYYSSVGERQALAEKIRNMRAETPCDLFVLSLHIDEKEYGRTVTQAKKERFKALAAAGADIIWANHPHVLQGWEIADIEYEDETVNSLFFPKTAPAENGPPETEKGMSELPAPKPLKFRKKAFFMYSMGNFISGQRSKPNYQNPQHYWEYTGDSALMQLKFPKGAGFDFARAEVNPVLITAYHGTDGIVVKRLTPEWAETLPEHEQNYYLKRLELMKAALPL